LKFGLREIDSRKREHKTLACYYSSLTAGGSPHDHVAEYVERELTSVEASLVSTTVDQLRQLESTEQR